MDLTKMTGNLEQDFKQIINLNSKDDCDKRILLNNRFVCKFREKYEGNGEYCYCSESYSIEPCQKRLSNDILLIVFDKMTRKEFYGKWIISCDRDLSNMYTSALYEMCDKHVTGMFTVIDYKFANKEDLDYGWGLRETIIDDKQSADKAC